MKTYDEKVDDAVHAAFGALGLSVDDNHQLAMDLADFIGEEFQAVLKGDKDDA